MRNRTKHVAWQAKTAMLVTFLTVLACTAQARTVQDFKLKNVNGKYVSLSDFPDAKGFVIVFTCNHCPFAKLYPSRMNELNRKYKAAGVYVIAISSADTVEFAEDTYSKMADVARRDKLSFPYLQDAEQTVAKNFSAQRTPQAFVIWKEGNDWVIKYSGAIDDNGAHPDKVTHSYVQEAVDALLHGLPVKITETRSVGCGITYR